MGCWMHYLSFDYGSCSFSTGSIFGKILRRQIIAPLRCSIDSDIKSDGAKFIRQLLVPRPKDRPLASQALRHQWITSGGFESRWIIPPNHTLITPLAPILVVDLQKLHGRLRRHLDLRNPRDLKSVTIQITHHELKSYRSFLPSNMNPSTKRLQ
jgi:hypothetical protein